MKFTQKKSDAISFPPEYADMQIASGCINRANPIDTLCFKPMKLNYISVDFEPHSIAQRVLILPNCVFSIFVEKTKYLETAIINWPSDESKFHSILHLSFIKPGVTIENDFVVEFGLHRNEDQLSKEDLKFKIQLWT